MDRINKNAIESIRVFDKSQYNNIEWREEYRTWLSQLLNESAPAAFYFRYGDYPYSKEDLENGKYNDIDFLVIGKKIYFKPYVQIALYSGQKRIVKRNTYKQACDYARKFVFENNLDKIMIYY